MPVISVNSKDVFQRELTSAGPNLVVVDFFATWCGPCQRIAPRLEAFSVTYNTVKFLKVDVEIATDLRDNFDITVMPTFIFFINGAIVERMRGGSPEGIELEIKKQLQTIKASDVNGANQNTLAKGHINLYDFLELRNCECLNSSDVHVFENCLTSNDKFLESDCDEQLIIMLSFQQSIKLHSLKFTEAAENSPLTVKLFINQPRILTFDEVDTCEPIQTITLTKKDLTDPESIVLLKYVKFQRVDNIILFVKDNQNEDDVTKLTNLTLFGTPVMTTNMSDFKRVAGKAGEAH